MATTLTPYLAFRDTAREAMEFYRTVLGGELTVTTFAEFDMGQDPADNDKVMHAQLTTRSGLVLMASDTPGSMDGPETSAHSLALFGQDPGELRGLWDGLCEGATITAPLEEAPWGDIFGMLTDRFGIHWMISIEGTATQG